MSRVLIVDDDLVARILARHIVVSAGCEVLEASNGFEALRILAETSVDVILCDQEMPEMNGLEVLANIRKTSNVPFVLLTGHLEREELEVGDHPVDYYLSKPASSLELTKLLRQALAHQPQASQRS